MCYNGVTMKIVTEILHADVVDKQNDYFTKESLEKSIGDNIDLPVTVNFDGAKCIGKVKKLTYKDSKLYAR